MVTHQTYRTTRPNLSCNKPSCCAQNGRRKFSSMRRSRNQRTKKPKLVTQYLETISSEAFENHADVIKKFVRGRNGVYALYRKGKLYYSGLASDLRGRL